MVRKSPYRLLRWVIFGLGIFGGLSCVPPLENEIDWDDWSDEVIGKLRVSEPSRCTSHSLYLSANNQLPYEIVDQRVMMGEEMNCSPLTNHIQGTDLGVSVHFDGARDDIIYFGDTSIPESRTLKKGPEFYLRYECAYKASTRCNDVYGFIDDDDPTDGVDVEVQTTSWAHLNRRDNIAEWTDGFASIRLMGLNTRDLDEDLLSVDDGHDVFGEFTAPSGAMPITGYSGGSGTDAYFEYGVRSELVSGSNLEESPGVLMVFATANNEYDKKQSWIGCSLDGITFRSCNYPEQSAVAPLSTDKFIQISLVPFSRDDVEGACAQNPGSIFCGLDSVLNDFRPDFRQGALLFGNGKYYRCSPLYLAYLELSTGDVWYFGGSGEEKWSRSEESATAIIASDLSGYNPDDIGTCPDSPGGKTIDAQNSVFGEVSVKLIDDHFVMLSNHPSFSSDGSAFVSIYYRTAPWDRPEKWSEPQATDGFGYGPFILDRYTEIIDDGEGKRLRVFHVLSTWNPTLNPEEPYSVMTKQLKLKSTGQPPTWPPEE